MDKKIALYTFFDDNFFEYGATMLYSFVTNNPWFKGDIFIFSDNGENSHLSEENLNILKKIYDNTFIYKIDMENYTKVFENFRNIDRREFRASFYKIEIFRKDDYDVKFFIDADVCFTASVEELFGEMIDRTFALMARDIVSSTYGVNDFAPKTDRDYANMGFLVVNGKLVSENHYPDLLNGCANIVPEGYRNAHSSRGLYGDQDCLNEFIKIAIMVPANVYDACVAGNVRNAKILHYYGQGRKPWDYGGSFYDGFWPWYRYHFEALKKMGKR